MHEIEKKSIIFDTASWYFLPLKWLEMTFEGFKISNFGPDVAGKNFCPGKTAYKIGHIFWELF